MKVIHEQPFNFEFECSGCHSQLAAEADDVKVGYFGANYGGETPRRGYYVDCIVCGTTRQLDYNETTPKVRELADSKEN